MGASQQRKKRMEEKVDGLTPKEIARQEEEKKRRSKAALYWAIGIVVALLVIFVILVNSSLFTRGLPAVKIGENSYNVAQTRYAYQTSYATFYNNYNQLISYFLDPSKPLDEQQCSFDDSITWKDYFLDEGCSFLQEMTYLYEAAKAEGLELDESEQAAIDANLEALGTYASANGYTKDAYIASYYGEGNTEATVRDMLTRTQLAYKYATEKQQSFTYTDEEKDAYYDEHADSYNTVRYYRAFLSGAADEEAGLDAETAMAQAVESAEAILDACDGSLESFQTAVLTETGSEASAQSSAWASLPELSDWFLSPERQSGDVTSVESESGVTLYCFDSLEDNSYRTVNVRHILIRAVDADEDGEYSEEELATALDQIKNIQAQWDGTEEDFIRLATLFSEDTGSSADGGLYENIYKSQMVPEFDAFCFEEHEKGDSAIVYGSTSNYTGYHLMYYVGQGDIYSRMLADNALRSQAFADWQSEQAELYPVERTFMFRYV